MKLKSNCKGVPCLTKDRINFTCYHDTSVKILYNFFLKTFLKIRSNNQLIMLSSIDQLQCNVYLWSVIYACNKTAFAAYDYFFIKKKIKFIQKSWSKSGRPYKECGVFTNVPTCKYLFTLIAASGKLKSLQSFFITFLLIFFRSQFEIYFIYNYKSLSLLFTSDFYVLSK